MANFGTRFAYPSPDWVAYRKEEEVARASRKSDVSRPAPRWRIAHALRRLARAWVAAHEYNSYR